jgi:hypothetical protein
MTSLLTIILGYRRKYNSTIIINTPGWLLLKMVLYSLRCIILNTLNYANKGQASYYRNIIASSCNTNILWLNFRRKRTERVITILPTLLHNKGEIIIWLWSKHNAGVICRPLGWSCKEFVGFAVTHTRVNELFAEKV